MATSRYLSTPLLAFGEYYGSAKYMTAIRSAIKAGTLPYREAVLRGRSRLDTVSGEEYGDGRYWWIIAAASDIGWALQCPPGTVLYIPDLAATLRLISG